MTALLEHELIVQEERASLRQYELQELLSAAERAALLSVSVEDLLRLLAVVQPRCTPAGRRWFARPARQGIATGR